MEDAVTVGEMVHVSSVLLGSGRRGPPRHRSAAAARRLPDERIEDEAVAGFVRALSVIGRRGVAAIGGNGAGWRLKRAVTAARGKREQRYPNAGTGYARYG